jgi:hypothetical protein
MSQTSFLRDMDASMATAFADAGLADAATYTPPGGGSAVPCMVYVDRDVQVYAVDQVDVAAPRTVVTFLLAQVANPQRGGTVLLTETSESFALDAEQRRDESRIVWVVA